MVARRFSTTGQHGRKYRARYPKGVSETHKDPHLASDLLFRTLERIGPSGVPHLVSAPEGANDDTKFFILQIIGQFGDAAKAALPALVRQVESTNQRIRNVAIKALGAMRDSSMVPLLISLLDDPSLRIRHTESTPGIGENRGSDCCSSPNKIDVRLASGSISQARLRGLPR